MSLANDLISQIRKLGIVPKDSVRLGHKSNPAIGPQPHVIVEFEALQNKDVSKRERQDLFEHYEQDDAIQKIKELQDERDAMYQEQFELRQAKISAIESLVSRNRYAKAKGFDVFESSRPNHTEIYAIELREPNT